MNAVDEIIADSIQEVLAKEANFDKEDFDCILKDKYRFTFDNVSNTFYTFHLALKENLGLHHYRIEREIISTMHRNTKEGKYRMIDEIQAFTIITKIVTQDNQRTIEAIKKSLEEAKKHLDAIDQAAQNDQRVRELKDIESFNKFRLEIQESFDRIEKIKKKPKIFSVLLL